MLQTMAGVKNTASQPHRVYSLSPCSIIFSRPTWCLSGRSSSATRSSFSWLAATAAAPGPTVPTTGTPPAHEAATARNNSRYCHHVLPKLAAIVNSQLTIR